MTQGRKEGKLDLVSTGISYADTPFNNSVAGLLRITFGIAIGACILVLGVLILDILLLVAVRLESFRSKISLKIAAIVGNVITVLALALSIVAIFYFFNHTAYYREDIELAGQNCVHGPCASFFWSKSEESINDKSVVYSSWGPDSGWILFFVFTLVLLILSCLSSPFAAPGVTGAKRFADILP